jgi:hypothetical protein
VKEQSHKSEMGAALRGDFERLAARREGSMPPAAAAPPVSEPAPELSPEPGVPVQATAKPEPVAAVAEPGPAAAADLQAGGDERRSWFGRMRHRR